jgi:CelD/BcsL family acetyltransferase involved in cellulose biosynthesis
MRKLRENYKVEVKTQHDFSSIDEAMEIFFDLHQKRWGSKGKLGAFASKAFRDFHLDLARTFEERAWLALYFLMANDEPVAAVYSFDYHGKKYGYLTGFDPDFGRYGVGNLLKMHVVEDCIKKGFREYDLMRDLEPYKAEWATGFRKNFVVRSVHKGLSAKIYDWAMQNSFSLFFINKFGIHLNFQHD